MARKKILLVDDSKTVLLMEQMILGQGDYEVLTAENGEEGVEVALRERVDLILLDIVMPVMDGFGACRALRENPETKDIPIIFVTTRGEPANLEAAYELGCNDYLTKPVDNTELLAKVREQLAESGGRV